MKQLLFAALLLLCTWASFAQTEPSPAAEKTSFEMKFEGIVAVSYGSDTFGVNVGGPSLKYRITPNFKLVRELFRRSSFRMKKPCLAWRFHLS